MAPVPNESADQVPRDEAEPNPFEAFGLTALVAPERRRLKAQEARQFKREADAPLAPTAAEKKQQAQERLLRSHKRWRRAQYKDQLMGPNASGWRALTRELRSLTMDNGPALVEHVRKSLWLSTADRDTRFLALSLISAAIARLRIRNGYAPFDDSLFGEEPTAYEMIREMLR